MHTTASRHCPALFLTACSSGQGKTTLVAALARHHHRLGQRVRVFKTGPDFLDPMILSRAAGSDVEPLDLWMVGEAECRRKLHEAAGDADLILIEGAMGLFDGTPSGADIAENFNVPVAALIDAKGMGQTFGAIALGLATYRPALRFAGVLANQVASARHAEMLSAGIPAQVTYLGGLPRLAQAALPSRHLGLVQAAEIADLEQRLDAAADAIANTALAALPAPVAFDAPPEQAPPPQLLAGLRIAVARDQAFSFIYADNLRLLEAMGARLSVFSPLSDTAVDADAIYLPGGYPELHLDQLGANVEMKRALIAHAEAGRPIYAECGGMLYLLDSLTDKSGHEGVMVGLLPGKGQMQTRLAGLGMQALELPQGRLRGHSFHHSTMQTPVEPVTFGIRQRDGQAGEPFYRRGAVRASYLHLYFPSAPEAAAALFLGNCPTTAAQDHRDRARMPLEPPGSAPPSLSVRDHAMPKQAPFFLTMLEGLIGTLSVSSVTPAFDHSNRPLIDLLAGWLESAGFKVELLEIPGHPDKRNLLGTLGSGPGGLVLSGHTDTVPFDAPLWTYDPLKLTEADGRYYGLGTSDMKTFFALALEAARGFDPTAFDRPLMILATADEESAMNGARALVDAGRPLGRYAVIGEPTGLRPVRLHKGVMGEAVRLIGRSGHASDPSLGNNAMEGMHEVIGAVLAWRDELRRQYNHPAFKVPYPTLNLGHIHGGDNPNRICGDCELHLDLRVLPGLDPADLRAELSRRVAEVGERRGLQWSVAPMFEPIPPVETPAGSAIVTASETLTGHAAESVSFGTEAPFLNQLGMETVVLGPGDIAQAHQPDEFLALDRIPPTLAILRALIRQFCVRSR